MMMIDRISNNETTEAIIYLKDGRRKYGKLIHNENINDPYYFISNSNLNVFRKTKNQKFIEIVSGNLIESIDVDLR